MCKANQKPFNPGPPFQSSQSGTTAKDVAMAKAQQLFADPHASIKEKSAMAHEVELASSTLIVDPSSNPFIGNNRTAPRTPRSNPRKSRAERLS